MRSLKEKGLDILYYGVETGDDELLERIGKGANTKEMEEGCKRAHEAGFKLSITVILGLSGREGSGRHARETAILLNKIQPRYLSALTLMLGPYEDSYAKELGSGFTFNSAMDDVLELREMVANLETDRCIFRSNHASNYLSLQATLIKDKERLLREIDTAAEEPDSYFRKEWMRGL